MIIRLEKYITEAKKQDEAEKTTEEKGPSIGRRKGRRGIGGLLTNILGWVMEGNRKESPTFQFIHVHLSALQPYFTAKLRRGKVRISLCIDLHLKVEGHVMRLRARACDKCMYGTQWESLCSCQVPLLFVK